MQQIKKWIQSSNCSESALFYNIDTKNTIGRFGRNNIPSYKFYAKNASGIKNMRSHKFYTKNTSGKNPKTQKNQKTH